MGVFILGFSRRRRLVCWINLSQCFPSLSFTARLRLMLSTFVQIGIGLVEAAWVWFRPKSFLPGRIVFEDADNLLEIERPSGTLILCPHITMIEVILPALFARVGDFSITYRPNNNQSLNQIVEEGRSRYANQINVRNLRSVVKTLRAGEIVWFAPDQDVGIRNSVFANFFGVAACTTTIPTRLVQLTGCDVVFMKLSRNLFCYRVAFERMSSDYGTDVCADAGELNAKIEQMVSRNPEQYWWVHRRFKTAADGSRRDMYDGL